MVDGVGEGVHAGVGVNPPNVELGPSQRGLQDELDALYRKLWQDARPRQGDVGNVTYGQLTTQVAPLSSFANSGKIPAVDAPPVTPESGAEEFSGDIAMVGSVGPSGTTGSGSLTCTRASSMFYLYGSGDVSGNLGSMAVSNSAAGSNGGSGALPMHPMYGVPL